MNTHLGLVLKEVVWSVSPVAFTSTQLSTAAENISKGARDQVGMATQVASASTEMNRASEDVAKNSNKIAESAGQTVKACCPNPYPRFRSSPAGCVTMLAPACPNLYCTLGVDK